MKNIFSVGRTFCVMAALMGSVATAVAQTAFDTPAEFTGRVSVSGENRGALYPGATAQVSGSDFMPGQTVTVERGDVVLADHVAVDDTGAFSLTYDLPEDAAIGTHPIIVKTQNPYSAEVISAKISPKLALEGAEKFDIATAQLKGNLYQVAESVKNGTIFVTSAVGRPPVEESYLFKLDATTLKLLAETTPEAAPARGDRSGGVFAVYGVGVDDAKNTVWVTNTRQNTVAVYSQDDLSLIKQFPPETAGHPRDVVIDAANGRAYVSGSADGVLVFDTASLEVVDTIAVPSGQFRQTFTPMSLALNTEDKLLYTVSLTSPEAAKVDLSDNSVTTYDLAGAKSAIGVDASADGQRIFVVSQGSDDLKVLDADGAELNDIGVGAGPLNVAYVDADKLAYVVNRQSGNMAVVDADGAIVANLDVGTNPNHLIADDAGTVFVVSKTKGKDDPMGNTVWRITPKK
ncbi:hypothetical protein BFP70_01470 [Thioclava sp. SK-1]|uniref:YncE family protein n=1 Tax=Thioclava sp. SK-1 TaxID=1889770 RepID=UPI000824B3C2|nr:YncE family protein [Thioclava sp. SK-1]OCX61275.1 hypothetical protein BFP70_01470 [Thioclava sp. SK-1]